MGFIIAGVIIALIVIWAITTYNGLVKLRNKCENAWSQVSVVLKRRADLIPNLVETVKGYAKHESETLEKVMAARNAFTNAATPEAQMASSGELTRALGRLFAVAEAYPDLKANQNFTSLQNDLRDTENKIQYARQFYNDAVNAFKNKCEMFPSNIIANMGGFKPMPFFEVEEADKEVPKVQF